MSIADWATRKRIKISLRRIERAYNFGNMGAVNSEQKIFMDVINALSDIFITDNKLLAQELKEYFGAEDSNDVYNTIKKAAAVKHGSAAAFRAEFTA